jgi:hypothetical protein
MDILIFLLFIVGVIFFAMGWAKSELQCPPPKIVYKYIPENLLDTQFSKENMPSEIYKDLFLQGNTWIGGYKLNSGLKSQTNTEININNS